MSEKTVAIAIDGPAGAGKSSLAKALAKQLGFIYVDTGALYRTIGLYFIQNGMADNLPEKVTDYLSSINIDLRFIDGVQHVFLGETDVSEEIRTPLASKMASAVSAKTEVRAFLLDRQRDLAKNNNVIMDGRDIGTVVLPDAKVKIFLTASDTERATRRYKELIEKGSNVTFDEVLKDMKERDYADSHRAIAPLKPAPDSILADTTGKNVEQSTEMLLKIVEDKLK